jgi:predicted ATP-binding protein involved in virulence
LSLLAEEFQAAPENGRGQVILTTHSPKLLDHFDAEQIRVVELDGFATKIGCISNEQKDAIHEKPLDAGELLTVDPARIQQEATAQ